MIKYINLPYKCITLVFKHSNFLYSSVLFKSLPYYFLCKKDLERLTSMYKFETQKICELRYDKYIEDENAPAHKSNFNMACYITSLDFSLMFDFVSMA